MPTEPSHRPQPTPRSTAELVDRARALVAAAGGRRVLLGLTGAPGAGKSTLASRLVEALGPELDGGAVLVGMDGFHLAQATLESWGRADRKGAPDTFDADGYVALLRRLRAQDDDGAAVVHAPEFRRDLEEPVGSAVPVAREARLVVTEGNYLLLEGAWTPVSELLDEVWFLAPDEDLRVERLVVRHEAFGKSHESAVAWSTGPDQANADVVTASAARADLVVVLTD